MHEHGFGQRSVTGTKAFGSTVAKVFALTSPDEPGAALETYYSKDGDGVTNHGNNDPTDTLTPAIGPYLEARFPVTPGVITTISRDDPEMQPRRLADEVTGHTNGDDAPGLEAIHRLAGGPPHRR